jgi:hypothetical protein
MTDDECTQYRERFHDAETDEELAALLEELKAKHPGDPFAMTLAEEIVMALEPVRELEDETE